MALKRRTQQAADAQGLPVAWPGEKFEPPVTGTRLNPFLAVGGANSSPIRITIGPGPHDRSGILTLVHVAMLGEAWEWYIQKAGGIAEFFVEDTKMKFDQVCVRVTTRPRVADPYRDGGYLRTPVLIPWQLFA